MNNLTIIQGKHTAEDKVIGVDYQFYYFMYLALNLKHGDKIGFEVMIFILICKMVQTAMISHSENQWVLSLYIIV